MTVSYLDCVSGISGDMLLAALIDAGADLEYITRELGALPIPGFRMWVETVDRRGITAKQLRIEIPEPADEHMHSHGSHEGHAHRSAATILRMIRESPLPERVRERSAAVFEMIAAAEARIHGVPPEEVGFHEVGAMDSILDTIGICLALENLGVEEIRASPVPTGSGKVRMAHGLYPVPAPATAELLRGIPLAPSDVQAELTTPTGAGVLRALVSTFGPLESLTIDRIGYGAGSRDLETPNILRVFVGRASDGTSAPREVVHVLEAHFDDCSAETLGYAMERLFRGGALDVFFTAVQMKKNRPGTLLTVLAAPAASARLEEILLTETTTFGVRRSAWTRTVLRRETVEVQTPYGAVRTKIGRLGDRVVQATPEYEDVARLARERGVPFREVYRAAESTDGR